MYVCMYVYIYIYFYLYAVLIFYFLTCNKILYAEPADGLLRPKHKVLCCVINA